MIATAAHADLSVRAATFLHAEPPRQPLADPTAMASAASQSSKYIQLALALPQRLRTFLARYPPPRIFPDGQEPKKTAYQEECPNPFLPYKHPVTGKWHNPKYSLRRQAELVKMAREHGVEELLPYTPKGTEARLRKRIELGLRVKGTGVGQRVKGHKHERQLMAKYVCNSHWGKAIGYVLGPTAGADSSLLFQDGGKETSHAGDARAHQGMEEGLPFAIGSTSIPDHHHADFECRLGRGIGQNIRNKQPTFLGGMEDVFRLYQYHCTTLRFGFQLGVFMAPACAVPELCFPQVLV